MRSCSGSEMVGFLQNLLIVCLIFESETAIVVRRIYYVYNTPRTVQPNYPTYPAYQPVYPAASASNPVYPPYQPQGSQNVPFSTDDNWCPAYSRANLAPSCLCEGSKEFPIIKCEKVKDEALLGRRLQSAFSFRRFGKFMLTNSEITSLEEGSLPYEFELIQIKKTKLKSVKVGLLLPSRPSLKRLEIVHNELVKFPFSNLTLFPNLQNLDLYYNHFTKIPDRAFGSNPYLKTIDLSFNKISYIGSFAFYDLPALESLDLRFNKIKIVNNHAFASSSGNPLLTLDLSQNKMYHLADDAFVRMSPKEMILSHNVLKKLPEKHFGPMLRSMVARNNGAIVVEDNKFQCKCEEISWLLQMSDDAKKRVEGFECSNLKGKSLSQLTRSDVGCYES